MLRYSKGLSSPAYSVCDMSVDTSSQKVSYRICRFAYHQPSIDLCISISAAILPTCPDRLALTSANRPLVPCYACGCHVAHQWSNAQRWPRCSRLLSLISTSYVYIFIPGLTILPLGEAQMMLSHDWTTKLPSIERWQLFVATVFRTSISNLASHHPLMSMERNAE